MIARLRKEKWEDFAERHGDWGRDMALHLMHTFAGLSLPVLARAFDMKTASAVSVAARRFGRRLMADRTPRKLSQQAWRLLNVEGDCQ